MSLKPAVSQGAKDGIKQHKPGKKRGKQAAVTGIGRFSCAGFDRRGQSSAFKLWGSLQNKTLMIDQRRDAVIGDP